MKTIQKTMILAILGVLMVAPVAMARPMGDTPGQGAGMGNPEQGPGGGPDMMENGPAEMLDRLDLTPKQLEMLKKDQFKKRKQMVQLRADLEILHMEIAEEAGKDKPDMAKIETNSKKIGEIHGQMTAERIQSIIYLRSILTDKQKEVMDAQHFQFGFNGMERKGRGKQGNTKRK